MEMRRLISELCRLADPGAQPRACYLYSEQHEAALLALHAATRTRRVLPCNILLALYHGADINSTVPKVTFPFLIRVAKSFIRAHVGMDIIPEAFRDAPPPPWRPVVGDTSQWAEKKFYQGCLHVLMARSVGVECGVPWISVVAAPDRPYRPAAVVVGAGGVHEESLDADACVAMTSLYSDLLFG
jgi:hypothetical protein